MHARPDTDDRKSTATAGFPVGVAPASNLSVPHASVMHIGEFAERTGMSQRTIRHYDQVGLLQPSGRSEGGFRLYTDSDVAEMLLIRRMKPLGYSLEEMAELLGVFRGLRTGSATADDIAQIREFARDAADRRLALARQLDWADEFIGLLAGLDTDDGVETDVSGSR